MKKWFLAVGSACLIISGGCANEKKDVSGNKQTSEQEQTTETVAEHERIVFPLTGLEAEKEADNRIIAVMINNHPKARPQSGLPKADLVYEVLAEGDITRLLALYQSELPEKIGPVRSARDYFIELSNGYNALYICHGWSPEAKEMLESGEADYLNGLFYDGTLFERASFRKAPHNSYTTFGNIEKGAKEKGYELEDKEIEPLPFFKNDMAQWLAAKEISIVYSQRSYAQVQYKYDEAKRKYIRFSNGEQTVDYDTNEPVLLDNLFIVEMNHTVVDAAGRRYVDLTSGGKGYLFQNGYVKEVEWKNVDGRILPYEKGVPVPLGFVPGKTWINIVPDMTIVQYS